MSKVSVKLQTSKQASESILDKNHASYTMKNAY